MCNLAGLWDGGLRMRTSILHRPADARQVARQISLSHLKTISKMKKEEREGNLGQTISFEADANLVAFESVIRISVQFTRER